MAVNSTEVSYGFGQMGSIHVRGTTAVTSNGVTADPGVGAEAVFVAITFLEDTTFNTGTGGLIAEQKIKELISNYEVEMEKQITDRWKSDMDSDSWLSKNVRPMVLIFLVVATVLMIFIDAGTIKFVVEEKWTDLLQLVLITVIGAYFGGRSLEKTKK